MFHKYIWAKLLVLTSLLLDNATLQIWTGHFYYRNSGSPGPSRFANAGRPGRTGMILTLFRGAAPVEAVNPDWLRFIPLSPRPGIAPLSSCPGRAPVYRNTTGTHRGYTGIRLRQSYGNAPVLPRSTPVMPRRNPVNAGGVPAERRFTYVP
ncbi:hypothetical protein DPMN_055354 [Dreissena polymorpha]|uniref:Secreted protein n=1 Tax=Dreissena polymorpha TaxID=45954 RepID=A0A9D4HSF7_DREPO|nr:hypothetical protein DPMN_055354 [Dreissena polymorpha]